MTGKIEATQQINRKQPFPAFRGEREGSDTSMVDPVRVEEPSQVFLLFEKKRLQIRVKQKRRKETSDKARKQHYLHVLHVHLFLHALHACLPQRCVLT
jgi:hypothetical protein